MDANEKLGVLRMYKNKITKALLLGAGLAVAASSSTAFAADVPAGTKLADKQELVRGNGTGSCNNRPAQISRGSRVACDS